MSDLEPPPQEVSRWPALKKVAIATLFAVVAALGIVWGIEHWQTWPLREAETSLAAGDPQRAEALASFYLDGQPDDPRGLAVRARALVQLGRGSEAVAIYEQIGGASPDDIHAWAAAYLLTESWSRGKHLLEQYLRMQPGDPEATYELATCTARLGRIKDAIEMATRFTELSEQKAPGLLLQAIFSQDLGDSVAAADAYRLVIEEVPDAAGLQLPPHEIFLQFGNTLLDRGDAAAAAVQFQRSIAILPTGEAYFRLGRAAAQTGDQEAALNAWKQAVEIQPESVSPREALAEAALARADMEAAQEWLAPLAEVASERAETAYLFQRLAAGQDDSDAFNHWKNVADQARQRQQRDRLIEQFVIAAPTNPWAIAVRAHRFAAAGNWQQAGDLLEGLPSSFSGEPFVQNLRTAVQEQGPLPSLDSVPINEP